MAECKSCKINLNKQKREFKYPENQPISKEMWLAVEGLRSDKNGRGNRQKRSTSR